MLRQKVVVFLGSESDLKFASPMITLVEKFGIEAEVRIASAHKDSRRLIQMIEEFEKSEDTLVYVTIAGMSNALSGFVDFKTRHPVIACPHLEERFTLVDIYSSLRMPRGVAPMVVLSPENAAVAATKILAETNPALAEKVRQYQHDIQLKNKQADEALSR